MKRTLFFFCSIILISCSQTDAIQDITLINGYWEIEKVVLADGNEKHYNFNQTIDFFELRDSVGVRKKLQPQLDGTFINSRDSEKFLLKIEQDSLRIQYQKPLNSWSETIISLKENKMVVKNETQNLYFYKRYQKLEL